jgi:hypothetical protein
VYFFQPFDIRGVEKSIAKLFLKEYPQYIKEFVPQKIPAPRPEERMEWVANVSGNPMEPEFVYVPGKKKEDPPMKVENPKRQPLSLSFKYKEDQIVVSNDTNEGGNDVFDQPPIDIVLPPYERLLVPQRIAFFVLQRDNMQYDKHRKGRVITCRAPSDFEPNSTWDLDDVRVYAHLVDPHTFDKKLMQETFKSKGGLHGQHQKIEETKRNLLRHLFFWLVHPRYALPNEPGFNKYKADTLAAIGDKRGK